MRGLGKGGPLSRGGSRVFEGAPGSWPTHVFNSPRILIILAGRTGSASSLSNMLPSGFSQGLGQMPSVGGPLDNGLPPAAPPPISQYANLFADMF